MSDNIDVKHQQELLPNNNAPLQPNPPNVGGVMIDLQNFNPFGFSVGNNIPPPKPADADIPKDSLFKRFPKVFETICFAHPFNEAYLPDIYKISATAKVELFWICPEVPDCGRECVHVWNAQVYTRTKPMCSNSKKPKSKNPSSCPFCSKHLNCIHKSAMVLHPSFFIELNFRAEEEEDDSFLDYTLKNNTKTFHWICDKGHDYEKTLSHRYHDNLNRVGKILIVPNAKMMI